MSMRQMLSKHLRFLWFIIAEESPQRQILIVWHLNTSDNYTWYQVVRLVFRCVILMCLTNVFKSEKIYNLNETDCERVPSKSEIL